MNGYNHFKYCKKIALFLAILSDFAILIYGGRERLEEAEEILSLKRIASNIALGVYAIGVSYEPVDRIHLHAFFCANTQ